MTKFVNYSEIPNYFGNFKVFSTPNNAMLRDLVTEITEENYKDFEQKDNSYYIEHPLNKNDIIFTESGFLKILEFTKNEIFLTNLKNNEQVSYSPKSLLKNYTKLQVKIPNDILGNSNND